jgi:hypothetical protein
MTTVVDADPIIADETQENLEKDGYWRRSATSAGIE